MTVRDELGTRATPIDLIEVGRRDHGLRLLSSAVKGMQNALIGVVATVDLNEMLTTIVASDNQRCH